MSIFLRGKLGSVNVKSIWITLAIVCPLAFGMEYVYLGLNIWTFSEAMDPLLGIRIWGAPIEEFSFWFGGAPFFILVYLSFDWLLRRRKNPHG